MRSPFPFIFILFSLPFFPSLLIGALSAVFAVVCFFLSNLTWLVTFIGNEGPAAAAGEHHLRPFFRLWRCAPMWKYVCVCVCVLMRIMFISPPPVFQHRLRCRLCRCLVSHCLAQSFLTGRYWTLHVCLWHIISLYPRFHRYRLIVRLSLFLPLNVLLSTDHCSLTAQLLFCQKRGTRWKGRKTAQSVEKLRQRRRRRILPQNRPRCAFCRRCCCCSCKWKCMCSM